MTPSLTSLGFTLEHDKGKIEIDHQNIYGGATVFVRRGKQHGQADLDDAIKNKYVLVTNEAHRKINLLPEELKFLWEYRPVFTALKKVDAYKLGEFILSFNPEPEYEEPQNKIGE